MSTSKKAAPCGFLKTHGESNPSKDKGEHFCYSIPDAGVALTSPHYEKASTRSKRLPRISKEHSAVEEFRSLQSGDIIEKMQAQRSLGESVGSVHSDAANELLFLEKPKYIPPLFALVSSACLVLLMGLWLLNEGIWLGLYRKLRRGISTSIEEWWKWLLLLDGGKHVVLEVFLWLFLTPVLLVLGRTMLFIFTHLFCARGLWLFPNLLMDDEFLAIFYPLFEWDRHPKESLGLRWKQFRNRMKAEMGLGSKHRKKRKRKISRTALKKAVMYRKES